MTHADALNAAQQLSDLAIEIEAALDPEIIPFEAHLASMATDTLEAVGHAHTIAAYMAGRIMTHGGSPDLIRLAQRLASFGMTTLALILPFLTCNVTDAVARQIWF